MEKWLTIPQFCKKYSIPAEHINCWVEEKRIHSKIINGEICINVDSFLSELWKENERLQKLYKHYRYKNTNLRLHYRNLEALADKLANMPNPNINLLKEKLKMLMIPERDRYLLRLNVNTLNLNCRAGHFFRANEIFTIEDLLRYLKVYGWEQFPKFRNIGKVTIENLKSELIRIKVINENMESHLLKYIIV